MLLLASGRLLAQHQSTIEARLEVNSNTIQVTQQLTFFNQTQDTISTLVLNDWNHSYSDKNSYLGQRFSDEFIRSFHFATAKELGSTTNIKITDTQNLPVVWQRAANQIDLIEIPLTQPILPTEKRTLQLTYTVKIPSDRFTRYGYDEKKGFVLKQWFLAPARYENHEFVRYSNADLDDIANGLTDYELSVSMPSNYQLHSDLNQIGKTQNGENATVTLSGKQRTDFSLYIEPKSQFYNYKKDQIEVVTNLKDNGLHDIQKALLIDRIVTYTEENIGKYPYEKLLVSEVDYERNPFYGLNQLPSFINVFQDEFVYELKFLKTYLNNYLKNALHLDPRKDQWIYDGIQVYMMMKYIDEFRPEMKMMGGLSKMRLLKSWHIINRDFNDQYSYYYLLMARKNLDQALGEDKDKLIRFNEKIASKYRAGLSLKYLDRYLNDSIVPKSIRMFYEMNAQQQRNQQDFENLLKTQTPKNIDWFFNSIIDKRDVVDYTFGKAKTTKDSITFTLKNKSGTQVPIPVYGLNGKQVVFKQWLEHIAKDSSFTIARQNANKLAINYENEVPEFNRRNNWKALDNFWGNDRPYKFNFFKDLENPDYNQIVFVPSMTYNYYDGLAPGLRLHNKTMLTKPFNYDVNPVYSPNTGALRGLTSLAINQFDRDSRWYYTRYGLSASYFNYAPDASYFKINPNVTFHIRDEDIRKNARQALIFKYNVVQKQETQYLTDNKLQNYSVFSFKYLNSHQELVNYLTFLTDTQLSTTFGKLSGEMQYRRLFANNRQINFRLYAGAFLYNKESNNNTFDFGLTSINDYLFEQELLGRSEQSGIFSQQFIMGEGGFKSKVLPAFVNKWLVTTNLSFNVWNWIEIYGDLGLVKNGNVKEKFVYDNGIRLNLVPDYFEFYFPVYSNNGWEIAQPQYSEKIRIVLTLDPRVLVNLFTRKWF